MALQEIKVPDLDGASDVGVVEIYINIGDVLEVETPLISLESDKAVMDVPSPEAGTVTEVKLTEGDTVNSGDVIAIVEVGSQKAVEKEESQAKKAPVAPSTVEPPTVPKPEQKPVSPPSAVPDVQNMGKQYHATPSVRSLARELGVDLARVSGTGPHGRITREDLNSLVKSVMQGGLSPQGSFHLPPIATADYASFGEIKTETLSRIQKISGPHLHRNWLGIPHVTQFEEADITELEKFRKELNEEAVRMGATKLSPLIFIIKATVEALKIFPDFNSSLNQDGASVTRKYYYNMGIAVDTPGGLMVPVIKDVNQKGLREIASELTDLSNRARKGSLKSNEMKGATFSISSLGGIGGTYFTPIINAPEVGILGLSRSNMKPVWNGQEFVPRLILPFSVSYDHRVIDGAQGARFVRCLSDLIADLRRLLL